MKNMAFVLLVFLLLTSCTTMTMETQPPLKTVNHVDLSRYVGDWYEVARYPNSFQKGCVGSMATYTLMMDGKIEVLNQCRDNTPDGKLRTAKATAWVVDKTTNAKLKVTFFWPFAGDYWIIELGRDYEYAVIGHPTRKYLWILCRTKQMDEALYNGILARLAAQGYDTTRLIKTDS